jgi:plastocyanin
MADEPTEEGQIGGDAPDAAPDAGDTDTDTESTPEAATPAVRESAAIEPVPVVSGPGTDPRAEARRTRVILPLLIPIGAILTVAFVTFNISRIFLASSEGSTTPAVLIAAGITLTILIGASVLAAFPDIRTSSLVLGGCGVMVVILLAGSLVLGASQPEKTAAAGFKEPAGPAINTLEVDALPTLSFQAKNFAVPGGINQIKYNDKGGTHTLVFGDNKVPGFELMVPNGKNSAKVDLTPNSTYEIYCTIPGHKAAGMDATITVGAAGGTPQPGTKSAVPTTVPLGGSSTTVPGTPTTTRPSSQASTGGT